MKVAMPCIHMQNAGSTNPTGLNMNELTFLFSCCLTQRQIPFPSEPGSSVHHGIGCRAAKDSYQKVRLSLIAPDCSNN